MSLKDSVSEGLGRLTRGAGPALRGLVGERVVRLRARLDLFNQSLADRALPEDRKKMVGRLALAQKAKAANQDTAAARTARPGNQKAARKARA